MAGEMDEFEECLVELSTKAVVSSHHGDEAKIGRRKEMAEVVRAPKLNDGPAHLRMRAMVDAGPPQRSSHKRKFYPRLHSFDLFFGRFRSVEMTDYHWSAASATGEVITLLTRRIASIAG